MVRLKKQKESISTFSLKKKEAEQYLTVSFRYITSSKKYTFDYFAKNDRIKGEASLALFEKLKQISSCSWREILELPKQIGLESIGVQELRFSPTVISFSPDEKVYVLRFCSGKYRIIGKKEDSVLQIIGFDFNHSAYGHGK